MEMREKFLPIGSVVLLKGGTKKAMITGFCSIGDDDQNKVYDYSGCIYPEGYLSSDQICLFDHDQIEKIFFIGYEDEEQKDFMNTLQEVINDYQSGELEDVDSEDDDYDDTTDDSDLDDGAELSDINSVDLEHL